MRKMKQEDKKVPISVAFDKDVLTRLENAKGRISRSSFINIAVDRVLKLEENKIGRK